MRTLRDGQVLERDYAPVDALALFRGIRLGSTVVVAGTTEPHEVTGFFYSFADQTWSVQIDHSATHPLDDLEAITDGA